MTGIITTVHVFLFTRPKGKEGPQGKPGDPGPKGDLGKMVRPFKIILITGLAGSLNTFDCDELSKYFCSKFCKWP